MLEVRDLNRGRQVRDISFQLHRGEILGIAGLVGAGRTEVVARDLRGGLPGVRRDPRSRASRSRSARRRDAVRHGIAYLSEDRKRYGLALGMDVEANTVLAVARPVRQPVRLGQDRSDAAAGPGARRDARDQDARRSPSG